MLGDFLGTTIISAIVDELQDVRQFPNTSVWSKRIPTVSATDMEIIAHVTGNVAIADIIADDATAVVKGGESMTFTTSKIPNIKHGYHLSQEMLNLLARLERGGQNLGDMSSIRRNISHNIDRIRTGVQIRAEQLMWAMMQDYLTYDGLGIKLTGTTWGMNADAKATASVTWSVANAATMKPITDILTLKKTVQNKYGVVYNRLTMSTEYFDFMIGSAEFAAKAQLYHQLSFPSGSFPSIDTQTMVRLAEVILGMTIELNDFCYTTESTAGAVTRTNRYLAADKVILTNSGFDNDSTMWDFANTVVTESIVSNLVPGIIGGFASPVEGPVAYAIPNNTLNPPNITLWCVQRGFPRKHNTVVSGLLDCTT